MLESLTMSRTIKLAISAFAFALLLCQAIEAAVACPFCSATAQTFSEELGTMDVAVIAKLVKLPPQSSKPGDEIQKATFEVEQIIKGEGAVKVKEKIETLYF